LRALNADDQDTPFYGPIHQGRSGDGYGKSSGIGLEDAGGNIGRRDGYGKDQYDIDRSCEVEEISIGQL
jgi:hypothetical protein